MHSTTLPPLRDPVIPAPQRRFPAHELKAAAAVVACAFAVRAAAFPFSELDRDESLYLVMARAWLGGHAPYLTIWDNKPPGMAALFALSAAAFGHGVAAMRIAGCLAVAATALLLERLTRTLSNGDRFAGVSAVLFYLALTVENDGLASNAELFIAPFVTFAAWRLARMGPARGLSPAEALAVGLAYGCAIVVKPSAIFDLAFAIGALAIVRARRAAVVAGLCGVALPSVVVAAGYLAIGAFPAFWDAVVRANLTRIAVRGENPAFRFAPVAVLQWQRLWPALETAVFAPLYLALLLRIGTQPARAEARALLLLGLWCASVLAGIGLLGTVYPHHFLQLVVPLAALAAIVLTRVLAALGSLRGWWRPCVSVALTLSVLAAHVWAPLRLAGAVERHRASGAERFGDGDALVAAAIAQDLRRGETVYVVNGGPILYVLLDVDPPTKYAFAPFLNDPALAAVAGVNVSSEVRAILARRPRFIVVAPALTPSEERFANEFARLARATYVRDRDVGRWSIYRGLAR